MNYTLNTQLQAKNGQNSMSPSKNNGDIDKDYYLRGSAALNETAFAEGKRALCDKCALSVLIYSQVFVDIGYYSIIDIL